MSMLISISISMLKQDTLALLVRGERSYTSCVEDMPPVVPLASGPERARRLRALWGGWLRILPPLDLRGVRRYRGIEEAAHDREVAVIRRARRLVAERRVHDTESAPR